MQGYVLLTHGAKWVDQQPMPHATWEPGSSQTTRFHGSHHINTQSSFTSSSSSSCSFMMPNTTTRSSQIRSSSPIRVILDTNVTLNCIAFRGQRIRPLVDDLEAGLLIAYTSETLRAELAEVLSYPRLRRFLPTQQQRDAALAQYDRWTAHSRGTCRTDMARWHTCALPRVKDASDQHLLDLALQQGVEYLVTKDRELLKCAQYVEGVFCIMTPIDFIGLLHPELQEGSGARGGQGHGRHGAQQRFAGVQQQQYVLPQQQMMYSQQYTSSVPQSSLLTNASIGGDNNCENLLLLRYIQQQCMQKQQEQQRMQQEQQYLQQILLQQQQLAPGLVQHEQYNASHAQQLLWRQHDNKQSANNGVQQQPVTPLTLQEALMQYLSVF